MASGLLKLAPEDERAKLQRGDVPVEMWDRMKSTPHGRYNSVLQGPTKPRFNSSSVVMNHFDVPKGDSGNSLLKSEAGVRGKRMTGAPTVPGQATVRDCLTSLPPISSGNRPVADA